MMSTEKTIPSRGGRRSPVALAALLLATALLAGCGGGEMTRREGMDLLDQGRYEEGLAQLAKAVQQDRGDPLIKRDFLRQREQVFNMLLNSAAAERAAERYDSAEALYRRVLGMDGNNSAARKGIADVEMDRRHARLLADAEALAKKGDSVGAKADVKLVLVENPGNAKAAKLRYQLDEATLKDDITGPTLNIKSRKPVTLQFRDANLKMVLEAISRTTGLNILVDKDVRNDLKVTIFVKDTPVEETLDLILLQNQLEKRVLGENTVLIYPFNPAKSKDYQELKVRRFALNNADPKQVQNMLKTILKTRDVFVDERTNAVVIRDTAASVRLAEKMVASMDQADAEVLLEVEIIDIDREWAAKIGIDWPTAGSWALTPNPITWSAFRNRTGDNINFAVTGVFGYGATMNNDSNAKTLASPRIRARNKEKAKILIGQRLPVIATATTALATGGTTSNTSISYLEVGTKLEVEPTIHGDDMVAIKLNLEVSDIATQNGTVTAGGSIAYTTNTSNATTVLQMKDGETQILGGLIQRKNQEDASGGIPGLTDIPVIGHLFGSNTDTKNNREIVLAITPHIIRNSQLSDAALIEMWSGTEANVKSEASNLRATGSAGVIGQGAAGGPSVAPPRPPVVVPVRPVAPAEPAAVPPPPVPPPLVPGAPAETPAAPEPGEAPSAPEVVPGPNSSTSATLPLASLAPPLRL